MLACLTSQQHASESQGRICSDNFTCCHTEMEVADQTSHLTQSQYTDTGPTSPSTDPYNARRLAGYPLECQFLSHWYDSTPKNSRRKRDSNLGSSALEADALTTRPTRRSAIGSGMDKDRKGHRQMEDSGGSLLSTVEGRRLDWHRIEFMAVARFSEPRAKDVTFSFANCALFSS